MDFFYEKISEPSKADYHFIKHMLESLHDGKREETQKYGRIACIVGNGFLHDPKFEKERKELQENFTIKAIISLPNKVFAPYVKTIKSNIILIEKCAPPKDHKTYFVKVDHDGLTQDDKRLPESEKNQFKKLLQLWKKWDKDVIFNPETESEIEQYPHDILEGFAEYHIIESSNWSANNYVKYKVPEFKTTLVELGNYISELDKKKHPSELVKKSDDIIEIKGVSKKYGIIQSDINKANEYKQKYKILPSNCLSYNPSRINVGSIALNEGENSLISPSYVIFKTSEDLLPKYILYFLKSEYGKKQIEDYNFGTVRNSLSFEDLSKIKIPFLPLERLLYYEN